MFLNAGPDTEYNMVNAGAAINEANEQEMFELIDSLDDMTCLVISGSLPPNTSEGFLAEVLRRVKAKGAEFVLDISSHQLADLIAMEPLLIKPNDDELLDIFGIKVSGGDDESVKGAMAELHAKGAKNVLLTIGGAGAYFSNGEHIWFANRTFDVKLLSTVCAGDSSLAAFLSVWLPPVAYNIFTVGYILFYGWFAGRFCNYVVKINYYLPAVAQGQEPVRLQAVDMAACGLSEPELATEKEHLRLALERWVAERRFTRPEEGREQIARELGTTKEFLCWYFKNEIGRDFRPWRVGLRIEYAKQLLAEELGISMNDLARKVGFATKSNFYGYFKKLTGETPVEYQRRIVSQC